MVRMTTTTTIYQLLLTRFWPNFKDKFLWPTIITTTTTTISTVTRTTTKTTTPTTTTLGCDSIELLFKSAKYCPSYPTLQYPSIISWENKSSLCQSSQGAKSLTVLEQVLLNFYKWRFRENSIHLAFSIQALCNDVKQEASILCPVPCIQYQLSTIWYQMKSVNVRYHTIQVSSISFWVCCIKIHVNCLVKMVCQFQISIFSTTEKCKFKEDYKSVSEIEIYWIYNLALFECFIQWSE